MDALNMISEQIAPLDGLDSVSEYSETMLEVEDSICLESDKSLEYFESDEEIKDLSTSENQKENPPHA